MMLVQASTPALQSDTVFDMMKKRVEANPERVKKINGVFQYNITKDGSTVATWSAYPTCSYNKDTATVLLQYQYILNTVKPLPIIPG
jgi:hypothetical protein